MSAIGNDNIVTLEDFLVDQCGLVTPTLLQTFDEHREFVETVLQTYDTADDWQEFAEAIWLALPEIPKEHFV